MGDSSEPTCRIIKVVNNQVMIEIRDTDQIERQFKIGGFIKVPHRGEESQHALGVVKGYELNNLDPHINTSQNADSSFLMDIELLGSFDENKLGKPFDRGSIGIPIPPADDIAVVSDLELAAIYSSGIEESARFSFATLTEHSKVDVTVDGDSFFNKHFAIFGSTGSGKSSTLAKIIQSSTQAKSGDYSGLNNSHVVIFDYHGEYRSAFPEGRYLEAETLALPYWLMDGRELNNVFLAGNERTAHVMASVLSAAVVRAKEQRLGIEEGDNPDIRFDTSHQFKVSKVRENIQEIVDSGYSQSSSAKNLLEKFEAVLTDRRMNVFGFGEKVTDLELFQVLGQLLGYGDGESNVTIIDLSTFPSEVVDKVVGMSSRLILEFGQRYRRTIGADAGGQETPILLVCEEAHNYLPYVADDSLLAARALQRVAREGRKHGVTLGVVTQRPSAISPTVLSQCNNFLAMRLTNQHDQNTVARFLPDQVANLVGRLPSLKRGDAIISGDSIVLPTIATIVKPDPGPKSSDLQYLQIWKEPWASVDLEKVGKTWNDTTSSGPNTQAKSRIDPAFEVDHTDEEPF